MKYFYTFFLATWLCTGSAFSLPDETINLIETELCYCRYMVYEARHGDIQPMVALDNIDEVLFTILEQIEDDQQQP